MNERSLGIIAGIIIATVFWVSVVAFFSAWVRRRTRTVYVSGSRGNTGRSGVWLDAMTGGIANVSLNHGEVIRVEIVAPMKIRRPNLSNLGNVCW